jgi:hypothetical protein
MYNGFHVKYPLSLTLLTWRIWCSPNNASKWQMGFNSAFKGLLLSHFNETWIFSTDFEIILKNKISRNSVREPNCSTQTDRQRDEANSFFSAILRTRPKRILHKLKRYRK